MTEASDSHDRGLDGLRSSGPSADHGPSLRGERLQSPRPRPVVLFDGLCNLCTGAVRFVLERDAAGQFDFASLQSATARRLLQDAGAPAELPDSIVLLDADGVHLRSDAALRIAARLRRPWPLTAALRVLPRALRDPLYDFVARHRYRWFGKRDACLVPTPELRARFLDASEVSASARATPPPSPGA